jgi:hypothetical protein
MDMREGCAAALVAWVVGCGGDGGSEDGASATSSAAMPGDSSTGMATSSGSADPDSSSSATGEGSSTTGAALQLCGIDDLAPGAANPIEAGDRVAMQLPTEIGDILARSCGCHFADDLVVPGDYPPNGILDLTTWSAWQSDFGTLPTYEAARARLDPEIPAIIMPPLTCNVGAGETMLPEDRARLLEWIAALAPDGATWTGM